MNRPKSFCPCCGEVVEWLNDHITPKNKDYRCGNCFEGVSDSELSALQEDHAKIEAKHKDYMDALTGVRR
jgi:hypothetical protein